MSFFIALQAVLSMCVCFMILLQQRAAGITATFGGVNTIQVQRRGAEKLMHQLTIAFSIVLVVLSVIEWYVV